MLQFSLWSWSHLKQDCISVGCVPPTSVAILRVGCLPWGYVCLEGDALPRGGVSAWRGLYAWMGCMPWGSLPWGGCMPGGGVCLERDVCLDGVYACFFEYQICIKTYTCQSNVSQIWTLRKTAIEYWMFSEHFRKGCYHKLCLLTCDNIIHYSLFSGAQLFRFSEILEKHNIFFIINVESYR